MTEHRRSGIYIHIPFCVRKCNYCAFLSFDAESSPRREYTEALIREIQLRGEALRQRDLQQGKTTTVDTVYIGGGTPSVLDLSQMRDIMHAVRSAFTIDADAEITLEANPGTLGFKDGVTLAKLQAYRYLGINRLSMGVQSMDNDRLRFMGRIHTAENVERDMKLIRKKGFDNVNLDLMFSIPGESAEDALDDLRKIIALRPEHISCYSLQLEEGTPFYEMAERGEFEEVSDEEDRKTYHRICAMLRDAGYEHYEISNFARLTGCEVSPYRSRHNSRYWDMSEYIGLGLGASGFTGGVRYRNIQDLEEYIRVFGNTSGADGTSEVQIPVQEEHVNTDFDSLSEAVFTGLRRREGIRYTDLSLTEAEFWERFADAREEAEDYSERGLLIIDREGLRLTEEGIDISNGIMSLFV